MAGPFTSADDDLQGNWTAESVHCSGEVCEAASGLKCEFKKDTITASYGDTSLEFEYKFDTTKSPKTVTVTKATVVLWKGIYAIDGDELKMCAAPGDANLPKELKTVEGDGRVLVVLKRD